MFILFILFSTVVSILLYVMYGKYRKLQGELKSQQEAWKVEAKQISIDAKKRSGAVQWGNAIENWVPFMEEFPIPVEDVRFFGKPIDFVGFTDLDDKDKCKLHIIEVKSGTAFLNTHQKNIKAAIENNRVYFHEVRVKGNRFK